MMFLFGASQTHGLLFQQDFKHFGEAHMFHKTLQERFLLLLTLHN